MWGAEIWLNYNKDVVVVDSVAAGDLGSVNTNIDNDIGCTKMIWVTFTGPGQSGNSVVASVTFRAVGNLGDSCPLDLDVKELLNGQPAQIDRAVTDGTCNIATTSVSDPNPTGTDGDSSDSTTSPADSSDSSSTSGDSSHSSSGSGDPSESSASSGSSGSEDTDSSAPIAIIVVACVCGIALVSTGTWLLLRRSRRATS